MRNWLLVPALLVAGAMTVAAQGRAAAVLTVSGPIDPISARYVTRGIDRAVREADSVVVIELDTPGGLGSSMDDIVARIVSSPVPVVVYVSPPGARAASAGVFIAMAAHVTAMAPGTHIGAAHPVGPNGADIPGAMGDKVLNDSVAKLRALADLRGRPVSWADEAVRKSQSITDSEAVSRGVAELSVPSLGDLLARLDGRTVKLQDGTVTLHTAGAEVRRIRPTAADSILAFLVNPDLAYILMTIGIFGIIFELTSPGAIAPGVVGALSLLLAFVGFGNLPTNVGGIVFIVLAIVLFVVDLKTPTHGFLTAGGVVAFVLGSLLLFPPWRGVPRPAGPVIPGLSPSRVAISPAAIAGMTVLVAAFFIFVLGKGIRAQARRVSFGTEALVGGVATAVTGLAPEGMVRLGGEQWSARSVEGTVSPGERVEVVGREGLSLLVRKKGGT
ncbi:MAG TPA: nodulation protein NfeD [Spirochaetia bacterium]|nr:nodulation protein NfeD [Spirochaetia bacterium]